MLKKKMLIIILVFMSAVCMLTAINISAGGNVTQNLSIGTSATAALPTGWKVDKNTTVRTVGTYTAALSATALLAGNSMSSTATNGIYNYGAGVASTATDRAVGWVSSGTGTLSGNLYVQLTNSGTGPISSFTISYGVEKYRKGSNPAGFSTQMYYSTNGTSWTSAGTNFLTSFVADADNSGYTTAPGVTINVSSKTLTVSVAAGSSLYLAWNYSVTSGTTTTNAQALGIDDVSVTAVGSVTVPTVTTTAVSSIGTTTATSGGNVIAAGGASVTARGVCWATTINPTIANSKTVNGSGTGTFTSSITGLTAATVYHVRAYATNSAGTAYGPDIQFTTTGDPFNGYYNPVAGLSGTALKTGLHDLIDNNTYSNYTGAKVFLFQTLDLQAGYVRCVYTGRDYYVGYSYYGSTDPNTEHTFCQSWMGTAEVSIKTADLHHLFPTSSSVNSSRGNLPFGIVSTVTSSYPSYNGYVSKRGTNSAGQTVFEPAAQHKGDAARSLLYFTTRYEMSLSISGVDMLPTMVAWHAADAVSTWEYNRNAAIYGFMYNRNPYVDHPEYVTSIWGAKSSNTMVQFSPASADFDKKNGTVTMKVSITNPDPNKATTARIILREGDLSDVGYYNEQTVVFPAGSSELQEITIDVTNDNVIADDRTLVFAIAELSGGKEAEIGYYPTFNLTLKGSDNITEPPAPNEHGNPVVHAIYPNPFNHSINLPITLSKESNVNVEIFNLKGQLVRSITTGNKAAGEYNLSWDGKDANGTEVKAGMYLYNVKSGDFKSCIKLIKIR